MSTGTSDPTIVYFQNCMLCCSYRSSHVL